MAPLTYAHVRNAKRTHSNLGSRCSTTRQMYDMVGIKVTIFTKEWLGPHPWKAPSFPSQSPGGKFTVKYGVTSNEYKYAPASSFPAARRAGQWSARSPSTSLCNVDQTDPLPPLYSPSDAVAGVYNPSERTSAARAWPSVALSQLWNISSSAR